MWSRSLIVAIFVALVVTVPTGCGFQLRGAATFPFTTIAIAGQTPLLAELARNVAAGSNAKVITDPKDAQALFQLIAETREKIILSLSTQGRVREFQLRYRVAFRVHDGKGGEYLRTNDILLRRDITFNDEVLAKEAEEEILFREMRTDMVQQIIRRMQASKLRGPDDE